MSSFIKDFSYSILLALMVAACFSIGCQRNIFDEEDDDMGGSNTADWTILGTETERLIKNIHATPFQLYALTQNEFVRFNSDFDLVEKRILSPQDIGVSRPVLSDNVFARMTANNDGRQRLEFHLARNSAGVVRIDADSIREAEDSFFEFEVLQRTLGAFDTSGTRYLQPARVESNGAAYAVLYLFELDFNPSFDEILSIDYQRIELPDLVTNASSITNFTNIEYFKGHFYAGTKQGGYRIDMDGNFIKIFPTAQWVRDYFPIGDTLYITGLNSFDLHKSGDGIAWERLNKNSAFQTIENVNGLLFNQQSIGNLWSLGTADLCNVQDINYGSDVPVGNVSAFYGIDYFANHYIFGADTQIFVTESLEVE